jgi:hypothetical protein
MQNGLTAYQDARKPPTRHRLQISQQFQAAHYNPQQGSLKIHPTQFSGCP